LVKINNEAKVCRSTRSVVLGKAKVISYKDIEDERTKRAAKEKVTASKGKRRCKRRNNKQEIGALDAEIADVRIIEVPEA
jgi:hypothetical protein